MEDFGEYTPLDSVSDETIDGTRAHNEYARELPLRGLGCDQGPRAAPIVRFQRSGWTGAAKCAQVVWGGDPTTGWGFDGLRSAVTQALSAGTSGIGIWGSDIGGFFALGFNELTPELLTRWVQFGAVSGVMRTQRNGVALPPRDRPQVTDPDQIDNWRRYTKLRTQLYPYISAAEAEYRRSGLPLMRHLLLALPGRSAGRRRRGRVPLRPRHPRRAGRRRGRDRARRLPARGTLGRPLALGHLRRRRPAASSSARPRCSTAQRRSPCPRPSRSCRCSCARARSCRSCRPTSTRSRSPAPTRRRSACNERRRRIELLAFPGERIKGGFNRRGTVPSRVDGDRWA